MRPITASGDFEPATTPAVRGFLILNLVVFAILSLSEFKPFADEGIPAALVRFLGLVPDYVFRGFVWQLFTYMFLHAHFLHFFLNNFFLWMFGRQLELLWGTREFVRYYLICGIGAGVMVSLTSLFMPSMYFIPTIGASGALFGLLIAYGVLFPHQKVLFLFVIPMSMRLLIFIIIGVELFLLNHSNQHGISNVAHLGGALIGFLYLRFHTKVTPAFPRWGFDPFRAWSRSQRVKRRLRLIKFEADDDRRGKPSVH